MEGISIKKTLTLFLTSALCLMMASCSNDEPQASDNAEKDTAQAEGNGTQVASARSEAPPASQDITIDDQTFHIIMLNDEILDFAKAVENDSNAVKKDVYTEKVVKPLRKQAAEVNAHIYSDYYSFLSPNTNIAKLKESAEDLIAKQDRILELVEQGIRDSVEHMPGIDKTIIIAPVNPDELFVIEKMGGVAGAALSKDTFIIRIDPSFNEEGLKHVVAHEYHHTLQAEKDANSANTMLGAFVLEGKADAFANIVYPDYQAPWIEPLSEKSQEKVFEELRDNGNDWDYKRYYEFMNGNSSKGIPLWSNYKTGYQIIQSYLKNHPDEPVEEWTALNPKEIISGSGFKEFFEELEAM
ncbi:DUF2268 domain-containing protein [Bacillus salacetis]|uniref:DUF2268 domain-containing protein n=1 Tax=Bacillus salacetis TaxID=2315464 RepID=UPI003BA205A5